MQDHDAVGQRMDHVHLVLDQQDGLVAARLQPADQFEDDRHFVDAHARSRFVEHQYLRLQRHQDRDFELAFVAVRQLGRDIVAPAGQADFFEITVGLLDQVASAAPHGEHVEARAVPALHRQPHVLGDRQAGKQIGELERAADAFARALRGAQPCDVFTLQPYRPRRRAQLARQQVEVGRLAGAVRPDDGRQRARTELGRHIVDRRVAAETNAQANAGQRCRSDHSVHRISAWR